MNKYVIGLFYLVFCVQINTFCQVEKDIKSEITHVTVFAEGAQIENEAALNLQQGKMLLSFTNLSPYIKEESIKVDGDGSYTILNVQFKTDFLHELEKSKDITDLNTNITSIQTKIEDEETWIKIINDKIDFLKSNKSVTGKDQSINPESFKSLHTIYTENIERYSIEILKRQRLINEYKKEIDKLQNQVSTLYSERDLPSGTIKVTIDAKSTRASKIKLVYLVDNANWYPSYDIRFLSTNKPLTISYKTNITQNTGVDWKNIELKLSTAKTNISAQIPQLTANTLHFYNPDIVRSIQGRTAGASISNSLSNTISEPQIRIRGISSDIKSNPLYIVDGVPQDDITNINPSDIEKMDIVKDASAIAVYGSQGANGVILITTKSGSYKSEVPLTTTNKKETSNEYNVEGEQTITSDNKLNTLTYRESELNATYEFQAIPKLSKNVYLIGKIRDWYKAEFMDGEANIYMENSYVGKSNINTQQFSDTLEISFGIDNNISVNREKIKEFSESLFIGSNKKETYAWKLTLRNNKGYSIKAKLFDQVPISTNKEIEVETLELSGGYMNPNTGKVSWLFELNPNETKQVILKYSVKYPKHRAVLVE